MALFKNPFSEEAKREREEKRKQQEAAKEEEYRRQQAYLEARRSGTWKDGVAKRRGQEYVDQRTGTLEPEPELPWAVQKKLIEEAAKAEEAAAKAAAAAAAETN